MAKKRMPAREAAQMRPAGEVWIEKAALQPDDIAWLADTRWLTLWNVTVPEGFLAELKQLEGIDLRGGSATDLSIIDGCDQLRCLVVNQIGGMVDLSAIASLAHLQLLHLYGLKQVTEVGSFSGLTSLRRLDLGLMAGVDELGGMLDAPELQELYLSKRVGVSPADISRLQSHPTLQRFGWFAVDVPRKLVSPVLDAIDLPEAQAVLPKDWFDEHG